MRVITYGTFDLFHEGHRRLLERAKALGDELVVGVTTENFDEARGKLNVQQSLMERIKNVEASGLADRVIVEEYEGQKIHDIQRYAVDVFAIGSDWLGTFDYLRDYCEVVYLQRTPGVSSTELRASSSGLHRLGVAGTCAKADRLVAESRFVSGLEVDAVYDPDDASAHAFHAAHHLGFAASSFAELLADSDAVYLTAPQDTRNELVHQAISEGVHVLCENLSALSAADCTALYEYAEAAGVTLLEATETAFCPGFQRLVAISRSGAIGQIRSVDVTFTPPADASDGAGRSATGAILELARYPLLAAVKLLGHDVRGVNAYSWCPDRAGADLFSRIDLTYAGAVASTRVGLEVRSEGELVVAGTQGYVYVPAPWWRTEYFELRFDDPSLNRKYFNKFDGDGLRYELAEFVTLLNGNGVETFKLSPRDSVLIADLEHRARSTAVVFG